MPNGEIEVRQIEHLKEIGGWLKVYGESIYGTRGGPIPPQSWGGTTQKKNTMYLHVFSEDDPVITLPKMKTVTKSAALIDCTEVEFVSTDIGTLVKLPENRRDSIDTVVVMEFDRQR